MSVPPDLDGAATWQDRCLCGRSVAVMTCPECRPPDVSLRRQTGVRLVLGLPAAGGGDRAAVSRLRPAPGPPGRAPTLPDAGRGQHGRPGPVLQLPEGEGSCTGCNGGGPAVLRTGWICWSS